LNVVALAGGAYLAWSGYQGRCPVKAALVDQSEAPHRMARSETGTQAFQPAGHRQ
jgi:threonine/homoserine/homoserine lactone efflux protein